MSDRYVVFENFKWGLDTRKSELTTQPGALLQCKNAHINSGGEIEQRKTFAKDAIMFPQTVPSYGLQDTDSGLITFIPWDATRPALSRRRASNIGVVVVDSTFYTHHMTYKAGDYITITGMGAGYDGTWLVTQDSLAGDDTVVFSNPGTNEGITVATGTVGLAYPDSVTPQVLAYPETGPSIPQAIVHVLTNVVSCNFLGKAFVIATFSDGNKFLFYDGQVILESFTGLVLTGADTNTPETVAQLAADLAAQINDEFDGWTATSDALGNVTIESPPGVYFTLPVTVNSVAGLAGSTFDSKDGPSVSPLAAYARFKVINGTVGVDTFDLTAFKDAGGTVPIEIIASTKVTCAATSTLTATAIAAAVNGFTALTGYTAITDLVDVVTVYAPILLGPVTFNLSVTTTGTADTAIPTTIGLGPFAISLNKVLITGSKEAKPPVSQSTLLNVTSEPAIVSASGGGSGTVLPTYTFSWVRCNADGSTTPLEDSRVKIDSPQSSSTTFSAEVFWNTTSQGHFKCIVTDTFTTLTTPVILVRLSVT